MGTYLIYRIDKGLGIISRETVDYLNFMTVREDKRYELYALIRGEGRADQLLPGGEVTARGDTIKLGFVEINKRLTVSEEFARLLKLSGAHEGHRPNSVASTPTNLL